MGPVMLMSVKKPTSALSRSSLQSAGSDEPFAEIFDSEGHALGREGGRRGHVTGAFFHAMVTSGAAF